MIHLPTLADVAARCKGAVLLSVNEHRSYYQTKAEYLRERTDEPEGNELAHILAMTDLYELQFYPEAPTGFLRVYGVSLDDVVLKALRELDTPDN